MKSCSNPADGKKAFASRTQKLPRWEDVRRSQSNYMQHQDMQVLHKGEYEEPDLTQTVCKHLSVLEPMERMMGSGKQKQSTLSEAKRKYKRNASNTMQLSEPMIPFHTFHFSEYDLIVRPLANTAQVSKSPAIEDEPEEEDVDEKHDVESLMLSTMQMFILLLQQITMFMEMMSKWSLEIRVHVFILYQFVLY